MQRAHILQLRNIENFALSIASEMFKKKGLEVKELFAKEAKMLVTEYKKLHQQQNFYEKKLK